MRKLILTFPTKDNNYKLENMKNITNLSVIIILNNQPCK